MTPVAVVGVTWRNASTALRAQVASVVEPIAELRAAGYLTGAACISTCSRTEWVITSDQPEWAANLLRGAIASRVAELTPEGVQVRAGTSAVHYLMRVMVGLDSVAEGESAVGRQVLKAFELARKEGASDRRLNRVWRALERVIHLRRETVPATQSLGVQSLVRETLRELAPHHVAILGRGDFGQAMERSLRPLWDVETFSRQSLDELLRRAGTFDAVVVCTGGASAWLELPARFGRGVVIDAGSPPQVRSAAEWTYVGLDTLLGRDELRLSDDERDRLEALVESSSVSLQGELAAPTRSSTLAALDAERTAFLNEQLPALLAGLPAREARKVKAAVGAFAHRLILKTREAES